MKPSPSRDDPTLMRNQPAILTGRRRRWLIPSGLLAAVTVALLVAALSMQTVVPTVGITVMTVLYLVMLVIAVTVPTTRTRNIAFAWVMSIMGAVALGLVLVLLLTELAPR